MKALDSVTTLMAANYDEKRGTYLNRLMKAKGVYPTPTQFVLGYIELAGKRDSISRADSSFMRYTPKTLKTKLMDEAVPASEAESVAISQRKENVYAKRMIRQMYKQGVPMLVGTDAPGFPLVPGFSVHQEMEHLVEIGMSTKAVLQAATINPARSLGWDKQMGSVAICKEADLILLDKNPLQDIKNIKKIHTVFVRGKLLTKKALEKMLEDVSLLCK
jgi:imidazolonepropionase-like amidohydrolase